MAEPCRPPADLDWSAADGTRIVARTWQPPGAVSGIACLVHGLGEHGGRYGYVAARLCEAGLAVLAADLRGHGRSGGRRGHATGDDVLLEDVEDVIDHARARFGARPLFLYGHSLGGNIVINHLLRRRPAIAGVVVTSPLLLPGFEPPAWKLALGRLLYRVLPTLSMSSGLRTDDLSRDPAVVAAYRADPLVHDRTSARLALDFLAAGRWALEHAADLALPLLLVFGDADRICDVEAGRLFAAAAGSSCTLVEFPGLYHEAHNEPEKAVVLDAIVTWLGRRMREAGSG
ncbi:MAG: alpha/beta hydrolase [Anaerolineae bacterium]